MEEITPPEATNCAVCQRPNRNYYTYFCPKTESICCTACRTFFVDSVRQRLFPNYNCDGDQNCDLAKKRGKALCKFCKFQKCQAVGMDKESIKPARKYYFANLTRVSTRYPKLLPEKYQSIAYPTRYPKICYACPLKSWPRLSNWNSAVLNFVNFVKIMSLIWGGIYDSIDLSAIEPKLTISAIRFF